MDSILQYSVNIAMEATIILVLVIILVTLFWQKKLYVTTVPLIFITSCIILMLMVQISAWLLLIFDVPANYGATPMRLVYVLDYVFSYGAGAAFYCYVEALVMDGYKNSNVTYKPKPKLKKIINVWGVSTTVIYSIFLFIPSLYRVENGIEIFSIPAYIGVHVIVKFAFICAMVLIIQHRKVIGKHEAILSVVFIMMIFVFVVVDELYDICAGHVMIALFVFMLYVSIDLHNGLLLERKEKEITEWKTQIMLSQMRPHFLYNVLTTISGMCEMENANEARDVVNHFADYFRTNLESLGKEKTILFEKELEHIKTYLWLEKVRFEDNLNVSYEIETTDFMVPSLAVQPIVENAVKHGILPKGSAGTVTIRTYETCLDYVIVIEDDGVGFDVNEIPDDNQSHVGIENVSKRLEIICRGSCEIKSEPGKGTIVTMHIPKGAEL